MKPLVLKRAVLVQFVTCKKSLIWQAFSLKEPKTLMIYLSTDLYVNRHKKIVLNVVEIIKQQTSIKKESFTYPRSRP